MFQLLAQYKYNNSSLNEKKKTKKKLLYFNYPPSPWVLGGKWLMFQEQTDQCQSWSWEGHSKFPENRKNFLQLHIFSATYRYSMHCWLSCMKQCLPLVKDNLRFFIRCRVKILGYLDSTVLICPTYQVSEILNVCKYLKKKKKKNTKFLRCCMALI